MPMIVAQWPNNTVSIVRMQTGFSMMDLFWELDKEGDPMEAKCYTIKPSRRTGDLHVCFDWICASEESDSIKPSTESSKVGICADEGSVKELPWPNDMSRQYQLHYQRLIRHREAAVACRELSAEDISGFPDPPPPMHTSAAVRAMPSFSGVYVAYEDDGRAHYVGESKDVTARVMGWRPEIGTRRIGVIKCKPEERKLIEAYFISRLDPPGNACSTHQMASKTCDEAQPA